MPPQNSPEITTNTPDTRVGGSIPSRATSAQQGVKTGKPGKTWEVGAPYIINEHDCPDWKRIVVCTHEDGRCRYLSILDNRRWPYEMRLSEHSTQLAAFGVVLWNSVGAIEGHQSADGFALYSDGKPRRWQGHNECTIPLISEVPRSWRMDPKVAPKLIKWITSNVPSVQRAKSTGETKPPAGFALVPAGEAVDVFELVDATDEERYYPLGLFFDPGRALRAAREHDPRRWDSIVEDDALVEVRARTAGLSGGDYHVLWRARWTLDFDTNDWLLSDEQTGTLQTPLPHIR